MTSQAASEAHRRNLGLRNLLKAAQRSLIGPQLPSGMSEYAARPLATPVNRFQPWCTRDSRQWLRRSIAHEPPEDCIAGFAGVDVYGARFAAKHLIALAGVTAFFGLRGFVVGTVGSLKTELCGYQ